MTALQRLTLGTDSCAGAGAAGGVRDPFRAEKLVWLALYEAARLSVKHNSVLVLR